MGFRIYHNPRCGKSRETLALLREHGIKPEIIEYLKTPPDAAELEQLLALLGLEPRVLLRKGEIAYTQAGLDNSALPREALIAAMVAQPILIERPIVATPTRAVLGRPPSRVLELL